MLTEEDFEKAENALKAIDEAYNNSQLFAPSLSMAEKTLYDFAKKVLAEARLDFLTDEKPYLPLEDRVKNLEASDANIQAALKHLCKILTWKIPPGIHKEEAYDVFQFLAGNK